MDKDAQGKHSIRGAAVLLEHQRAAMGAAIAPGNPGLNGLRRAALLGAVLLAAACSSTPKVDGDNLALAATQIDTARSAGADEYAAVEINRARSKLDQARSLAQIGEHKKARVLLDEAEADAQVARSKAASERSARALAEVEAGLRALRQQSEAAGGPGRR